MTSQQIIECIANFSEGRDETKIQAIASAIQSADVMLLDIKPDADHNRTVISFAGAPAKIEEAAFLGIQKAADLIDMDVHTGEHPRLGATDVVPFVPIQGVSMADCVAMANRVGERVGNELQIPVYLYEQAAKTPERENLAKVRKGQYEALKADMGKDPKWTPDYGPAKVGKAGGVVIGAREALVAFNVYLNTDDVEIAKSISKAVRHSSGGLRFVKGMGILVDGKAQVSMNLTNFNKTPVYRVVEMIRREAQRYGVQIQSSELIGLIPQKAMVDAAVWYLQLDGFDEQQILEQKLASASSTDKNLLVDHGFLDALASSAPTPGGGSAAAYNAAMAAALVAMVANLTIGRKKYAEVEGEMVEVLKQADTIRLSMMQAVEADAAAYQKVMEAYKLPKESDAEKTARSEAIQAATLVAAQVPLSVAQTCASLLPLACEVAEKGNANAITDAASALTFANAAMTAALLNVEINLSGLKDEAFIAMAKEEKEKLRKAAAEYAVQMEKLLQERAQISM